jgi:hypothetical protein
LKHKILYFLIILLSASSGMAQQYRKDDQEDPNAKPQKLGVRIGVGRNWLYAPEMQKSIGQIGLQGAAYYRLGIRKRFDLNLELGACYRGTRFDEKDTGNVYSRLGLFYVEMPLLGIYSFDEKKKHNLMFGPCVAYLVKPALYIGNDYYPAFTNLPIKKWDFSLALGYLLSGDYVGLYVGYKHGLNNLAGDFGRFNIPRDFGNNSPAYLDEVRPRLDNVKNIFNRSIELSFYF